MAGKSKTELGPGLRTLYLTWLEPLFPEAANPPVGDQLIDSYTDRPYEPYKLDYRDYLRSSGQNYDISVSQSDIHGVTVIPDEYYIPAHEAEETIHAIERLKDQRFSITCSFHNPHPPYVAAADYAALYPWQDMVPPVSINDDMADSPYSNNAREMYSDPDAVKQFITEYYGMVKQIDDEVGEILAKLDELGLTDNTMVIFVSDHGEMLGSHGMVGKFNFYEESSHVPMMIRFPGRIKAGTVVEAPISNMDLFATILDYMDMPIPPNDGKSLRGLIEGTVNEEDTYVVTEWLSSLNTKPSHMISKDGWKLMRPHDSSSSAKMGLYNLDNDPHERVNLVADQAGLDMYAAKVAELEACFQECIQRTSQNEQ